MPYLPSMRAKPAKQPLCQTDSEATVPNPILKPRPPLPPAMRATGDAPQSDDGSARVSIVLSPATARLLARLSPPTQALAATLSPTARGGSTVTSRRASVHSVLPSALGNLQLDRFQFLPVPFALAGDGGETAEERAGRVEDIISALPLGRRGIAIPLADSCVSQFTITLPHFIDSDSSAAAVPAEAKSAGACSTTDSSATARIGATAQLRTSGGSICSSSSNEPRDQSATTRCSAPGGPARISQSLPSISHHFEGEAACTSPAVHQATPPIRPSGSSAPPEVGPACSIPLKSHESTETHRRSNLPTASPLGFGSPAPSGPTSRSDSTASLSDEVFHPGLWGSTVDAECSQQLTQAIADLCVDLACLEQLRSLTVHHGPLSSSHVTALTRALTSSPGCSRLQQLSLVNCSLEDHNLEPLCEFLFFMPTDHPTRQMLHTLDFSHNYIRTPGLRQLQHALSNAPRIVSLSLRHNPIGHEHTPALISLLQHCTTLEHVDIGFCGLNDHSVVQIAQLLHEKWPLLRVDLDAAHISQPVAVMLLEAIEANGVLVDISLQYILFCSTNTYRRRVLRALRRNIARLQRLGQTLPEPCRSKQTAVFETSGAAQRREVAARRLAGFTPGIALPHRDATSGASPCDPFDVFPHPPLAEIAERHALESARLAYAKSSKLSTLGIATLDIAQLKAARAADSMSSPVAGDRMSPVSQSSSLSSDGGSSEDEDEQLMEWNGWERLGLRKGYRPYTSNTPSLVHRELRRHRRH